MKNEKKKNKAPAQEVYYAPAAPVNRKKLILRLLTVGAVVLALFLGFAIFFRVENVVVSGTEKYTPWAVCEASGIQKGESLLAFGKAQAAGRITQKLRYVKSVRIGITLPNTVNIYVQELEVVYSVQDAQGAWWLMAADGRLVDKTTQEKAAKHTQLKGFTLDRPKAGEQAQAVEPEQNGEEEALVSGKDCLEAALSVLYQLENNEILGDVAEVDVSSVTAIQLWYGNDYQVLLGDQGRMDEKIAMMRSVIQRHREEGGYQSGILDITLTTEPDGVAYTPF